ncbi:MAG TPA: VCBS repeat-containing protein, partial [bacterium]
MKKICILLICSALMVFGQSWNRVLEEYVGGILLAGAYSGSVNYSRPFWVDIDDDNDYDFFIGGEHGGLHYYRNDGTASAPDWTFMTEFYQSIDVENRSIEAFVDIDNDSDYDLFFGEQDGNINYYRNDGTAASAVFIFVTDNYAGISVGSFSAPYFCDIDGDNDFDLFIGRQDGTITYYRNDGTVTVPSWTFVSNTWFSIDVITRSIPWFADIDADNDYDLFVGCAEGTVYFYRNTGTPASPNMVYVTSNYTSDVGNTSAPSFVDIDNDGDLDLFIGEYIGNVNWYRNTGNASSPSWSFVRRHYVDIDMNSSCTPTLVDIDNDGDKDLFAGEWVGFIDYYQNSGTTANHQWTMISENYDSIDVGDNSVPTFVKIDGDNDYDMFIGNLLGNIYYYRNDGSVTTPDFTRIDSNYNNIDVGDYAASVFVDIDNDNDKDMFIGCLDGTIWYYRNDGSSSTPSWTYVSNNYSGIDVGDRSIPRFADLDNDGDFDLFIGEGYGTTYHYQNTGTPSSPSFALVTSALGGINVEENTCPDLADIDADGDLDLFIGERWGGLNLYLQIVTDVIPPMRPDIVSVVKTSNNVRLTWRKVTTDTLDNVENMRGYVVYRNTVPSYAPGSADSVGFVNQPDTFFTNISVLSSFQNYYYLVKAVDQTNNRSYPSNMGFKFRQVLNENVSLTDKNWVSLPYRNNYPNISDFYTDIALSNCYGIRK